MGTLRRDSGAPARSSCTLTMADEAKSIEDLRAQIDRLDRELLRLFNARAALAVEIGNLKRVHGGDSAFYRPEREAAILQRVLSENSGPLSGAESARLMREVMSACLALEHPMRVAYLGPDGTYTHLAALKHFGGSIQPRPLASIEDVFREVAAGSADFGVVPVENSIEGGVGQTLDALRASPLNVCGEIVLPIHHQLLSRAAGIGGLQRVYAHTQALGQCRRWLATHCPGVERVALGSNAEAVRRVAGEPDAAAIAAEAAGRIYDVPILHRNIEDEPGNTTRFLVIGSHTPAPSGRDLTSLMFVTRNRPGALYDVLGVFAEGAISMTRIESRPLREEAWDYVFFVDIEGHADDPGVAAALTALAGKTSRLKILGSYPRAVL